jgi:hypothetical protein
MTPQVDIRISEGIIVNTLTIVNALSLCSAQAQCTYCENSVHPLILKRRSVNTCTELVDDYLLPLGYPLSVG